MLDGKSFLKRQVMCHNLKQQKSNSMKKSSFQGTKQRLKIKNMCLIQRLNHLCTVESRWNQTSDRVVCL